MQAAQSALVTVKKNPKHATSAAVGLSLVGLGLYLAMHYLFEADARIQTRYPECFTPQDTCNVTMTVLSKVCKDACNLDNADAAIGIIGFTACVLVGAVLFGFGVRGMRQAATTEETAPLLPSAAAASVLPSTASVFEGATGAAGAQAFKKVTGAAAAGDKAVSEPNPFT
jgi:hypothetical protein